MIITQKQLDETDKKIIMDIKAGHPYKAIAHRLRIKIDHVKYRIRLMKKEYGCQSLPCLIDKLRDL